MLEMDEKKTATIFKAFCDENRIRILKLLTTGEKCGCKVWLSGVKRANGCTIPFLTRVRR